jgi:hypothetical protein
MLGDQLRTFFDEEVASRNAHAALVRIVTLEIFPSRVAFRTATRVGR